MDTYDPNVAPEPDEWLSLDEGERMMLVEDFHYSEQPEPPNLIAHCAMHVAVENQIAMSPQIPVAGHLDRLMAEGLGRHDAIHAIASVLAEHALNVMKGSAVAAKDPNKVYYEALARLSAAEWLAG